MTGRRVAAVLLALLVVTTGAPAPAALAAPAAPTAPDDDPCGLVLSDSVKEYCREGHERLQKERERQEAGEDNGGGAGVDDCPSGPAGALCRGEETGSPLDTITGDCKAAPDPDFPGTGISGWIDPGPATAPAPRKIQNSDAYIYEQYGYAGLRWHTYDLGCGGSLRDPESAVDNSTANFVFMWSKSWTALAVKLHEYAVGDAIPDAIHPVLDNATRAVRNAIFTPWAAVSLLIVAAGVILQARTRNAAAAFTRVGWALGVLTLVAFVGGYPTFAASFTDDAVSSTVGAVRQALAVGDQSPGPVASGPADMSPAATCRTGGSSRPRRLPDRSRAGRLREHRHRKSTRQIRALQVMAARPIRRPRLRHCTAIRDAAFRRTGHDLSRGPPVGRRPAQDRRRESRKVQGDRRESKERRSGSVRPSDREE